MHFLYSLCFTFAFILALPYFLVRGIWQKKYFSNFLQRLGWLSLPGGRLEGGIWIHAVSVGEVLAVIPLIRALQVRWPKRPLFVSTATQTGQALAKSRIGNSAIPLYFPFDWRFSVRRVLARIRPEAVLIAETEIWPNFLRECSLYGIPIVLVNGRISGRSTRRYGWIRPFIRKTLGYFSALCMQTEMDRQRVLSLGAPPNRTEVCGNLKFDLKPAGEVSQLEERYRNLLCLPEDALVVVAGSTMKHEEEHVLFAFDRLKRQHPAATLILAPRHPERFKEVEQLLASRPATYSRRSALGEHHSATPVDIWLLDSMGELGATYAVADIVFVGGSLVPRGGHNILEPALFKKPILFGPYMDNFKEVASCFLSQQAAIQVRSPAELTTRLLELAGNKGLRQIIGENGFRILLSNRGATDLVLRRVEEVLERNHGGNHCGRNL